jgi:hypothetical protein
MNCYRWKRSGRRGPGDGDSREDGAVPGCGGDDSGGGSVVPMAEEEWDGMISG